MKFLLFQNEIHVYPSKCDEWNKLLHPNCMQTKRHNTQKFTFFNLNRAEEEEEGAEKKLHWKNAQKKRRGFLYLAKWFKWNFLHQNSSSIKIRDKNHSMWILFWPLRNGWVFFSIVCVCCCGIVWNKTVYLSPNILSAKLMFMGCLSMRGFLHKHQLLWTQTVGIFLCLI